MTFREMLKLYKDGTLSDEQKELLEKEIEKHEAISDYLYENVDIPELDEILSAEDTLKNGDDDKADRFAEMVKTAIRRAFVKMGVIVGTAILAIVLMVIFVLPNVVSYFYYNPGEVVSTSKYGQEINRMELDLSVFSELFLPGKYRDEVICDVEGYGVYNITIPQTTSINGRFTTVAGRLERNQLTLYHPDILEYPTGNAFVLPEDVEWHHRGVGAAGDVEYAYAKLQELDEHSYYTAYFSLATLMDYESFYKWYSQDKFMVGSVWCGVYEGNCSPDFLGFCPIQSGRVMDLDMETYPMLSILGEEEASVASASDMQTHFTSMIKYMKDNPEVIEIFGTNAIAWDSVIDYINENGLWIYGFAVTADKETIIKIAGDDNVSYVYTTPLQ